MSEENVEIVRAGFDAFNRGDFDAWIAGYDEEVEMHDLGESPDTAIYRGHSGLREWLAKVQDAFGGGIRFESRNFKESDGVVLVEVDAVATGAASGVPIKMHTHCIYRVRERKVVWTKCFVERSAALEAAGLAE